MILEDSVIDQMKEIARKMGGYGSITLHFSGDNPTVDIEVNERVRVSRNRVPRAGEVTKVKRVVVVSQK